MRLEFILLILFFLEIFERGTILGNTTVIQIRTLNGWCVGGSHYPPDAKSATCGVTKNVCTSTKDGEVCRKRFAHLVDRSRRGIYSLTSHSVLRSAIDLMLYYKRHKAWFLIDGYSGLSENYLRKYLRNFFDEMSVSTITTQNDTRELLLENPFNNQNYVVICDQQHTEQILMEAADLELFEYTNTWIIAALEITEFWKATLKFVLKSDVALLKPVGKAANFLTAEATHFYDVFYSNRTGHVEALKFANWTVRQGVFLFEEFESEDLKTLARGRTIRTAAFQHLPYSRRVMRGTEVIGIGGYSIDSVKVIGEILGANFLKPVIVPFRFGDVDNNKTVIGMANHFIKKEADMAASGNALALSRTTVMRFIYPSAKLDLSMAYKTPPSYAPPTIFFLPFAGEVWALIFLALAVMVTSIALIMVWSPEWRHSQFPSVQKHSVTFRLMTGTFFDEALTDPPGMSARIVYAALLVATTLSFILYTSVVTSFLSYQEVKLPINTLKELVDNKKFRPVLVNSTVHIEICRTANLEITRAVWQKALRYGAKSIVDSYDSSVYNIIARPETVTVGDSRSMLGAMDNPCEYKPTIIKTPIARDYFYFVARLDLPYNRLIYMRFIRMSEEGVSHRIRTYHGIRGTLHCDKENASFSFSMKQALAPFCILLGGIFLSLFSAVIEKCVYHKCRARHQHDRSSIR